MFGSITIELSTYLRLLLKYIMIIPISLRNESYVCIATASPAKFPEAIEKSGVSHTTPDEIKQLFNMEEKFDAMDIGQDWEQILRSKIEMISSLA